MHEVFDYKQILDANMRQGMFLFSYNVYVVFVRCHFTLSVSATCLHISLLVHTSLHCLLILFHSACELCTIFLETLLRSLKKNNQFINAVNSAKKSLSMAYSTQVVCPFFVEYELSISYYIIEFIVHIIIHVRASFYV